MLTKVAEFRAQPAALLFADYCRSQGLQVKLELQGEVSVLMAAADDVPRVEVLLTEFIRQPDHPRYQAAAWQQSQSVKLAHKVNLRPQLAWRQMPLTLLVLLLTLAVYAWQQIDFRAAAASLMLLEQAELWRWITPILLHFSLTHLVFNLAWWWLLGSKIERYQSSGFLLQLALSSAVISNGLQLALAGPNFGGLSGVVYALVGYCYLSDQLSGRQRYLLSHGLFGFMLVWLVLGFMELLWINMANWAHLGGLGCGLLWAFLSRDRRRP
ncbi:GlpG protein [Alishewanella sp. WH16-1]|uniref:rhomboid family intramembrane serine protease GlpG n=1 Tax=Alishewanella sp. WH16-1 TaxID=1651088 RepID=UPI0007109B1E|nr:rhomboid family intramembrane serine protease GlpG [Alishewanella sp. WH16-1]KRS20412.1 GlpG protein [Alishewanella sp. WH16-1]